MMTFRKAVVRRSDGLPYCLPSPHLACYCAVAVFGENRGPDEKGQDKRAAGRVASTEVLAQGPVEVLKALTGRRIPSARYPILS